MRLSGRTAIPPTPRALLTGDWDRRRPGGRRFPQPLPLSCPSPNRNPLPPSIATHPQIPKPPGRRRSQSPNDDRTIYEPGGTLFKLSPSQPASSPNRRLGPLPSRRPSFPQPLCSTPVRLPTEIPCRPPQRLTTDSKAAGTVALPVTHDDRKVRKHTFPFPPPPGENRRPAFPVRRPAGCHCPCRNVPLPMSVPRVPTNESEGKPNSCGTAARMAAFRVIACPSPAV
jgi:hypothetical protein